MKSFFFTSSIVVFAQSFFAQGGNFWTQKASLPDSARTFAISFSIGDKGYVGTGNRNSSIYLWDFWEYNSVTDSWSRKADFTPGIDSVGRRSAAGFSIGDKGYVGPGVGFDTIPPTQGDTMYNDFWEYDALTDIWTQKTTLPSVGRQYYVAFAINNKGYIGTGLTGGFSGVPLNDFWEYDPVSDSWTQKANFGGSARYQAVGFSLQGKGYIGGGYDSSPNCPNDFWQYDPIANIWTQRASFTMTGRVASTAFALEAIGRGYIGTGSSCSGPYIPNLHEYNPQTNTWLLKAWYPGGGTGGVSAFAIGNRGYFTCGTSNGNLYNDLWEYTPDSLTGIEEFKDLEMSIYPNPSNGIFSINLNENNFAVYVYDISGRLINCDHNNSLVNIAGRPKGIYFLKVTSKGKSFTGKLVVQ